jgi:hypothetical protein
MKTCTNHPRKEAFSTCHSCGRDYCNDCLDEGYEFYYCTAAQCQELLFKEILPENLSCPNCNKDLELSYSERRKMKVHCQQCEAFINFLTNPPQVFAKEKYIQLLFSLNQGDIGIIKSILDDSDIDYYISGENFLTVEPLIQPARFYVNLNHLEIAKELLKDFELNIWGAS